MKAEQPRVRRVEQVMGFPVSLAIRGRHADDERGRAAWQAVLASLREAERVFSTHRPTSWISRLARGEVRAQECPAPVRQVLALAEQARRESSGAFDVHRTGPDGKVLLDTDGVVKGWALERAAAHLQQLPDTDFCLSGGGDLLCRTCDEGCPPWRIGIEDPHQPSKVLATVEVRNGAVATSGTAHRGRHLIDARTGRHPGCIAQVSVITASLTWADIDATAAYALGPQAAAWLQTRTARTGLIVWQDGSTVTTSGHPPPRSSGP